MRFPKTFLLPVEEQERTRSRIRDVLDGDPAVLVAYLFGSFLNRDGFNDIDIAVLLDLKALNGHGGFFDYQVDSALRIERELRSFPVDIVILNEAPLPLRFRVVSEGRLLVSKDEGLRTEFEARTRVQFFDFLPHLEFHYQKQILGR